MNQEIFIITCISEREARTLTIQSLAENCLIFIYTASEAIDWRLNLTSLFHTYQTYLLISGIIHRVQKPSEGNKSRKAYCASYSYQGCSPWQSGITLVEWNYFSSKINQRASIFFLNFKIMSDVYISCWFLVLHPTLGEQKISKPIPEMKGKSCFTI